MRIQHEETGYISEIPDDAEVPRRWYKIASSGSQACYKATDLVEYGYAPGNYTNTCQLCEQEFIGEKRARVCRVCALSRRNDDPHS